MTEPNIRNVQTLPNDSAPFIRFPSLGRILSPVHSASLFSKFNQLTLGFIWLQIIPLYIILENIISCIGVLTARLACLWFGTCLEVRREVKKKERKTWVEFPFGAWNRFITPFWSIFTKKQYLFLLKRWKADVLIRKRKKNEWKMKIDFMMKYNSTHFFFFDTPPYSKF